MKWKGISSNNHSTSVDKLLDRLGRLEEDVNGLKKTGNVAADEADNFSDIEYRYGLTEEEFEKLTLMERAILRFNWAISNVLPYYKVEVMKYHNLTSEEYDRRTMEGDQSIYLPQPNQKFLSTMYRERVAHILGLNWQQFEDKVARGEIEDRIAGCDSEGRDNRWRDEDPNAVF